MKCLVTQLGEAIDNQNLPIFVDVSTLVNEIVSKYSNVDNKAKEAFSNFIYTLVNTNVYNKIRYMFLPCLSSSINECFYDAVSKKSATELGFLFDNKTLLEFANYGIKSKVTSISGGACRAYFTPSSLALDESFVGVSINGSNKPSSDGSTEYIVSLRTLSANYDSIRFTSGANRDDTSADIYPKDGAMSNTGVKKDGAVVSKNSTTANLTDGTIVETQPVSPSSYDISRIEFFNTNGDKWGMSYTGLVYAYVIGSGTDIEENKIIAKALKQLSLDIRS